MEGQEASVGAEEIHGTLEHGMHPADHAWAGREPAGRAVTEPRHTDDAGGAWSVTDHGGSGPGVGATLVRDQCRGLGSATRSR